MKTHSPKLVSFLCSLWRLIWVYAVCIGLYVPIIRFFKFLIHASFVYVSNERERLYKISLFFSRRGFPPRFHVTYRYEHDFLMRGKGNVALDCSFSGYFNNCNVLNIHVNIMQKNNSTNIYLYPGKCGVRSSRFRCLLFKGSYLHMP